MRKALGHARIYGVLEHFGGHEALAVESERLIKQANLRAWHQVLEGVLQWRPNVSLQVGLVGTVEAEGRECVGDATRDARGGVSERSI